mmetsp:Transcript_34390/g.90482  ORF Transcript_34390/g.90482 Transcript_34390/m.90482 type:complete len:206 (+) Transcript_34390:361-978(+)
MDILEAEQAHPLQVAHEHGVVHRRAVAVGRRLEVAHGVEVGDVDAILIWLGAVGAVLLDVEGEEADVVPAALLEGEQRLRLIRKLVGVRVAEHLLVFDELLGRVARHEQRGDDAHRHRLALDAGGGEVGGDGLLDELAHWDAREVGRVVVEGVLGHLLRPRLDPLAVGAIVRPPLRVLRVVIQPAHPVSPPMAVLALHPSAVNVG